MTTRCPCGRTCKDCEYDSICGGCLEESCIHVRTQQRTPSARGCFFCHRKGTDSSHSCSTLLPPENFDLISPWVLEEIIETWSEYRESFADQQEQPKWNLLIPEVSDVSETTSRLCVHQDEGDWRFHKWNPIAWDMTGYLIDKIQGAPWTLHRDDDTWRYLIGNQYNWIEDILLIDRLPDYLAIRTPPTAIIAEYLNRLHGCQWNLESDNDAPNLWILTHGYPSYIDWPPAWHWNLGIRMLSSLIEYIGAAMSDKLQTPSYVWSPDTSKKTTAPIRSPFIDLGEKSRLIFPPHTEMDWVSFPGIIPFIPGADVNQLSWFAKQLSGWGYDVFAIDAMNTICHENFKGISNAVSVLKRAGAKHVIVYGPWPLHIPSKYVPTENVSYIPSAHHMDMTNAPARFWKKEQTSDTTIVAKRKFPEYRTYSMGSVISHQDIEVCSCPACKAAVNLESEPRSIWRWGHFLNTGYRWQKKSRSKKIEHTSSLDNVQRLWYQGPSSAAYRRCLHHVDKVPHDCLENIYHTVKISDDQIRVIYPDGFVISPEMIKWTDWDDSPDWRTNFPKLGDS